MSYKGQERGRVRAGQGAMSPAGHCPKGYIACMRLNK
jgi:hypothetical protein